MGKGKGRSYIEELKSRMELVEAKILELKERQEEVEARAKESLRKEISRLERAKEEMLERLNALMERKEAESLLKRIRESYEEAKERLEGLIKQEEVDVAGGERISAKDLMGMSVLDKDAKESGKVIDIYLNVQENKISEIVLRTGLRGRTPVSAQEIETIGDKVILKVDRETVEERTAEEGDVSAC